MKLPLTPFIFVPFYILAVGSLLAPVILRLPNWAIWSELSVAIILLSQLWWAYRSVSYALQFDKPVENLTPKGILAILFSVLVVSVSFWILYPHHIQPLLIGT